MIQTYPKLYSLKFILCTWKIKIHCFCKEIQLWYQRSHPKAYPRRNTSGEISFTLQSENILGRCLVLSIFSLLKSDLLQESSWRGKNSAWFVKLFTFLSYPVAMPFIRTTRKRAGEESFWRRKSDFPFKLTLDESTREFKNQANRPKIDRLANFASLIRYSLCQFAFQTEMDVLRYVGNVEQAENVIINSTLTWYGIKTIEFPNSSSTNLRENSINEKKGNSIPLGRWRKWNFYRRTFLGILPETQQVPNINFTSVFMSHRM